jgi:hypothetical protein
MKKLIFVLTVLFSFIVLFLYCDKDEEIVEEDYLFLYGDECFALDSITDSLVPLDPSICEDTVFVDTSGTTGDVWKIKLSELAPFMESLLDPGTISQLSSLELQFDRQSPVGGATVVGVWEVEVPSIPIIPEALLVNIVIEDTDSTFLFEILEKDSAKRLYTHNGSWELKKM